jgi:hypothetical protein
MSSMSIVSGNCGGGSANSGSTYGRSVNSKGDHMNQIIQTNQTNYGNYGSHGSHSSVKTFPCLYSSQKLKKKKSWNDGIVKVYVSSGSCKLFAQDDGTKIVGSGCLDTLQLLDCQLQAIISGSNAEMEIEFEKYLVTVELVKNSTMPVQPTENAPVSATRNLGVPTALTDLVKKSFKVPKYVAPLQVTMPVSAPHVVSQTSGGSKRGYYQIDDDEIDTRWDDAPRSSSPLIEPHDHKVAKVTESRDYRSVTATRDIHSGGLRVRNSDADHSSIPQPVSTTFLSKSFQVEIDDHESGEEDCKRNDSNFENVNSKCSLPGEAYPARPDNHGKMSTNPSRVVTIAQVPKVQAASLAGKQAELWDLFS